VGSVPRIFGRQKDARPQRFVDAQPGEPDLFGYTVLDENLLEEPVSPIEVAG